MTFLRWKAGLALSVGLLGMALAGCGGGTEVTLKDAPPVNIAPPEEKEATADKSSLKTGAPAKGSSAGLNFNPSQTDAAR